MGVWEQVPACCPGSTAKCLIISMILHLALLKGMSFIGNGDSDWNSAHRSFVETALVEIDVPGVTSPLIQYRAKPAPLLDALRPIQDPRKAPAMSVIPKPLLAQPDFISLPTPQPIFSPVKLVQKSALPASGDDSSDPLSVYHMRIDPVTAPISLTRHFGRNRRRSSPSTRHAEGRKCLPGMQFATWETMSVKVEKSSMDMAKRLPDALGPLRRYSEAVQNVRSVFSIC